MTPFEMLEEFHRTYNVDIGTQFTENLVDLRMNLIREEYAEVEEELEAAFEQGERYLNFVEEFPFNPYLIDKKKLTKELADLVYVTIGFATTFGLPLEKVFAAVHESNMSKLGNDGKPIYREDGKVLKGPNYKEPNLDEFF